MGSSLRLDLFLLKVIKLCRCRMLFAILMLLCSRKFVGERSLLKLRSSVGCLSEKEFKFEAIYIVSCLISSSSSLYVIFSGKQSSISFSTVFCSKHLELHYPAPDITHANFNFLTMYSLSYCYCRRA